MAKQVDAPRPERDAPLSRRTAGSNPAAGTTQVVVAQHRHERSPDNARIARSTIAPTAPAISIIRAWRNRQPEPPQKRAVKPEGSCTFESCRPDHKQLGVAYAGSVLAFQAGRAGIMARLLVQARIAHVEERRRCISQRPSSTTALSAPPPRLDSSDGKSIALVRRRSAVRARLQALLRG